MTFLNLRSLKFCDGAAKHYDSADIVWVYGRCRSIFGLHTSIEPFIGSSMATCSLNRANRRTPF